MNICTPHGSQNFLASIFGRLFGSISREHDIEQTQNQSLQSSDNREMVSFTNRMEQDGDIHASNHNILPNPLTSVESDVVMRQIDYNRQATFALPTSILCVIRQKHSCMNGSFKSDKFCKQYCNICYLDNQLGVLLNCCQNKQFICFGCYIDILFYQYKKEQEINSEFISYAGTFILEVYQINCPYCTQSTHMDHIQQHYQILSSLLTSKADSLDTRK